MRECWINVSVIDREQGRREAITGSCWATRDDAARATLVDYRLHVRLKPEPAQIGMPHDQWERVMGRR